MDWTLERGEQVTGVPAEIIREVAHAYAKADRAMICWTLGITEHHNAVDNVLVADQSRAADRPRRGLRQRREPAPRPEQRAGRRRHGRHPEQAPRLPGHRAGRRGARAVRGAPGACRSRRSTAGHLTQMFEAMERGELTAVYVIGENPATRARPTDPHARSCSTGLDCLIVQDLFMTKTAELADVVFPASATLAFESDGTVTNSERRVQRVRKALDPPGSARDDIWIIAQLADAARAPTGATSPRTKRGRSCARSEPDARRHELASASRSWAASSGRARTSRTPGHAVPARPALGVRRSRGAGREGAVLVVIDEPPVDELSDGLPAAAHDRAAAGLLQHRRADRRLHVAAATRRDDRGLARGCRADGADRGGVRAGLEPSRHGGGAGARRPRRCGPASCS